MEAKHHIQFTCSLVSYLSNVPKQCFTSDVTVLFISFFIVTGGTFYLDINIPDSYPFNPPKVGPEEELKGEKNAITQIP